MTFVAGECTQEGDLAMPIIETNEKLTRIIRGRSIELVIQEAGLVTIVLSKTRLTKPGLRLLINKIACRCAYSAEMEKVILNQANQRAGNCRIIRRDEWHR